MLDSKNVDKAALTKPLEEERRNPSNDRCKTT